MPFIQNISLADVQRGHHINPGENAMLIQICDYDMAYPTPMYQFKEVHQFDFLDAEDEDGFDEDFKITDEQAAELVRCLQRALENHMNVVVHCHAGICRSGAVVEVATMMGFTATDRYRQPNLRVKHKMMKVLGWTYDENEESEGKGGTISAGGILIPFSGV